MKMLRAKYGYHLSRRLAALNRWREKSRIMRAPGAPKPVNSRRLPFNVVTMAGRRLLPDVVRATASFLQNAGRPRVLWLASDGTLGDTDIDRFRHACGLDQADVQLRTLTARAPFAETLGVSVAAHPLMRKLGVLMSLPRESDPALFFDADIMFFAAANTLGDHLTSLGDTPAFLPDALPSLDGRLLRTDEEWESPVNSGLLWIPRPVDWRLAKERLSELGKDFEPTHFTEQTAVHLSMHASRGVALDPRRFVLSVEDQFEWKDYYAGKAEVICRHYVSDIRHKMWILPIDGNS